ncbi:hypothetical protein ACS0TY_031473 [Phlomoides rotata]
MQRVLYAEEEEPELVLRRSENGYNNGCGLAPVCLIGKLISEKPPNTYALINVMIKSFKAKGKLTARDWGNGLLIFSFELDEDRK